MPAAEARDFAAAVDHVVRRHPDQESHDQHQRDILDQPAVSFTAVGARHAVPKVVIGGQQNGANQHRLDHEQPCQNAAHRQNAHLLRVGVNFRHQPVTGKRQRQKGENRDEIRGVSHPVVMRFFSRRFRGQELERGVGADDRAAEGDIGQETVQIQRVPQWALHDFPQVAGYCAAGRIDTRWRHHESRPRISHHQQRRADAVEQQSQRQVHPFAVAVTQRVPAVVVNVEQHAFEKKQQCVDKHLRAEGAHHVIHELRVEQEQRQGQGAAEQGGNRVSRQADLHEFVRHVVIAVVAGLEADELDHQHEDRHRQHQRAEEQVHLREYPDDTAAAGADVRIIAARGLWRRQRLERALGVARIAVVRGVVLLAAVSVGAGDR